MTNRTVLGLAVVLSAAGFEAFMTLDWGHGIARALVVLGLLAVMASAIIVRPVQRGWPRWSLALVSMGVALLLVWHVTEGALSAIRQRHSEMGDIHARAVALLWHGVTPWHFGTVLDSGSFGAFVSSSNFAACRSTAEPPTQSALDAMWSSSTEPGAVFFAQGAQQQPCGHFFAQSGYKYGPAMLAALAAFAVLLGQSLLRRDTLYESDCDLIPTALMLWSPVASCFAAIGFERSAHSPSCWPLLGRCNLRRWHGRLGKRLPVQSRARG